MSFLKYYPHQESKRVTKPGMRRAGLVALTEGENVEGFGGKTEVKGRLAIHRLRQQTNIKMDLEGLEWEGVDRIYLTQKRYKWQDLVNKIMNICIPLILGNLLQNSCTASSTR